MGRLLNWSMHTCMSLYLGITSLFTPSVLSATLPLREEVSRRFEARLEICRLWSCLIIANPPCVPFLSYSPLHSPTIVRDQRVFEGWQCSATSGRQRTSGGPAALRTWMNHFVRGVDRNFIHVTTEWILMPCLLKPNRYYQSVCNFSTRLFLSIWIQTEHRDTLLVRHTSLSGMGWLETRGLHLSYTFLVGWMSTKSKQKMFALESYSMSH